MKPKIQQKIIPFCAARPGEKLQKFAGITLHETGNYRKSAGALAHIQYLCGAGKHQTVSSHYYVDHETVVQAIPEEEVAWHAGDGRRTSGGNMASISIEVCVNWGFLPEEYKGLTPGLPSEEQLSGAQKQQGEQQFLQSLNNAASLAADVLLRKGITNANGWLFMHHHWSGKDCPHNLRRGRPFGFDAFVEKTQQKLTLRLAGQPVPPQQNKLFKVQVGAFSNRENARRLIEQLQKDGYTGFITR